MATDQEEKDLAFQTFIGVVVAVCGNALISVALNVQKLAHNKLQEQQMANYFANMDEPPRWISASAHNTYTGNTFYPDDGYSSPRTSEDLTQSPEEELEHRRFIMAMAQEQRDSDSEYLRSKLWWLGITLMILGEVGNFVAYGFAPASTIAPLGTTTLVANVILAPVMLKEVFRKRDLLGIVLAVTGAAIVVLSSNQQESALSPDLIMESLLQMRSIIYFIVTGVAIITLTAISPWYGAESILVDLGLVAIYGGYTVLCTKSVASLLSLTLLNMFAYPISYVLILTLVITAVLQIKYLNKALQRFDSTAVIPTQFVLFTVSAIIGSAVIYRDFDDMSMDQMSRFMSGCAVEFVGVYLITSKRNKRLGSLALQPDKDELPGLTSQSAGAFDTTTQISMEAAEERTPEHTINSLQPSSILQQQLPLPARSSIEPGMPFTGGRANAITQLQQEQQYHRLHIYQGQHPPQKQNRNSLTGPIYMHKDEYQLKLQEKQRRRSSVIRGLSLASQLLDRTNDEVDGSYGPSPTVSTSASSLTARHHGNENINAKSSHRRSESKFNNILLGFSNMAHDVLSNGSKHHDDDDDAVDNMNEQEQDTENETHRESTNRRQDTNEVYQAHRDSFDLLEMDRH